MLLFFYSVITFSTVLPMLESRVCESVDVRNTPEHLLHYSDCRVIKGNLKIVLMEMENDPSDFYGKNFTNLVEISDYLLVFRVHGLTSLGTIFPKLTSIKGKKLFLGYSLIIYDSPDLEEIGLSHLETIGNGTVKIGNCPNLCYADTINWKALGISAPDINKTEVCTGRRCPNNCGGHCWNDFTCHRPKNKTQCHPLCLGCTQNNSSTHCTMCKYFNDSGNCVFECPKTKLTDKHFGRCVSEKECLSTGEKWSIFEGMCVPECPTWNKKNSTGFCTFIREKICPGLSVTEDYDLEQLRWCTHINGSLEISLNPKAQAHLDALIYIETITEYLKIIRSNSITTLHFFTSLQVIKGERLYNRAYSLYIADNENLQMLFNNSLQVEEGEILIQNNPYLCQSEIDKLNLNTTSFNNGFQSCSSSTELNVTVLEKNHSSVKFTWPAESNSASLLGYTVYYLYVRSSFMHGPVKIGNCDEYSWNTVFVSNNSVHLKWLRTYTKYDYYIKINYIDRSQNKRTPVYNFTTELGDPSDPQDLQTRAENHTSIKLKWSPPAVFNGHLSYSLAVYRQDDYLPVLMQRDFCLEPPDHNNCSCFEEEHRFFGSCLEDDPTCKVKTVYETIREDQQRRLHKRSVQVVQDVRINVTHENEFTSYVIHNLRPFTLYIFYLKACNGKTEADVEFCGGSAMGFQRTLKKAGADFINNITVEVNNQDVVLDWTDPPHPNARILAYNIEYKVEDCYVKKCFRKGNETKYRIFSLDPGKYLIRIQGISLAGYGEFSKWVQFEVVGGKGMGWVYGFLVFFGTVIVIMLGFVMWRKYKMVRMEEDRELVRSMASEMRQIVEEDEWQLDDESIEIIRQLGENSLGIFYSKFQKKFEER